MNTIFSTILAPSQVPVTEANANALAFLAICAAGAYSWKRMMEIIKKKNQK